MVSALGTLGVEDKAARQALSRTAGQDLLVSMRYGRRVLWDLTDKGRELLAEGTERIYSFMRRRKPWDGRWLVLSIPVPESRRQLRRKVSTRLTWLGMGSPTPGLWISPDAGRADEARLVLTELGLEGQAFGWSGPEVGIGGENQLLRAAWDLDDVEKQYLEFLDEFGAREVTSDVEAFVAQTLMIHAWRRFPFIDPDLPAELLSHEWPGPRAANTFHEKHARWHRAAQAAWAGLVHDAGALPDED